MATTKILDVRCSVREVLILDAKGVVSVLMSSLLFELLLIKGMKVFGREEIAAATVAANFVLLIIELECCCHSEMECLGDFDLKVFATKKKEKNDRFRHSTDEIFGFH